MFVWDNHMGALVARSSDHALLSKVCLFFARCAYKSQPLALVMKLPLSRFILQGHDLLFRVLAPALHLA